MMNECRARATRITPRKILIHRRDLLCCEESCRSSAIVLCISLKMTSAACAFSIYNSRKLKYFIELRFVYRCMLAAFYIGHVINVYAIIFWVIISWGLRTSFWHLFSAKLVRFLRSLLLPKYYYAKCLYVYDWLNCPKITGQKTKAICILNVRHHQLVVVSCHFIVPWNFLAKQSVSRKPKEERSSICVSSHEPPCGDQWCTQSYFCIWLYAFAVYFFHVWNRFIVMKTQATTPLKTNVFW